MSRPDLKPPSGFIEVIIMVRPYIPNTTFDEATADRREGISIINNMTYPMKDGEKDKAIIELEKIFSNSRNP